MYNGIYNAIRPKIYIKVLEVDEGQGHTKSNGINYLCETEENKAETAA